MSDNFRDTNNTEIDVEKLLAEIRSKLSLRERRPSESMPPDKPDVGEITVSEGPFLDTSIMRSAISSAEAQADVGSRVSPMLQFHGLTRKLAFIVGKIVVYVSSFITDKQRSFNRATVTAFSTLTEALEKFNHDIGVWVQNETNQFYSTLRGQIESLKKEQTEMVKVLRDEQTEAKGVIDETVNSLMRQIASLRNEQIALLRKEQTEMLKILRDEQAETKSSLEKAINGVMGDCTGLKDELRVREGLIRDIEKTVGYLKSSHTLQDRRLTTLLEVAIKHLTGSLSSTQVQQTLSEESKHSFDALYVHFEDQFRGSRQEIKKRLEVYIPVLKGPNIGSENMPVLDLGCGRGEWLELLREENLYAKGVEINRIMAERCREHGLTVEEGDLFTYMQSLPDASLGAVTAFHVIEHLPFESLLNLLDETVRVLKPGGLAIFETPNPQNVLVGSCNFYLDPTHRNPLPSPMMKFIAEARGLSRIEILNLHPYPGTFSLSGSELAERFNEYFYGPQDYAVIGWKA